MAFVTAGLISNLAWFWQVRTKKAARIWCAAAIFLVVTILLITPFGNVPINKEMKNWDTFTPAAVYEAKMQIWELYNSVRTIAALVSFICLLVTGLLDKNFTGNKCQP